MQYIWSTYERERFQNIIWGAFNFFFHVYFTLEFLLRLYAAKYRKNYILNVQGFVDVMSNFPFLLIHFLQKNPIEENNESNLFMLGNALGMLRILKIERNLNLLVNIFLVILIFSMIINL